MPETSGLVQRLKWAQGLRAVLVYVGPTPSATRLFVLLFDSDNPVDLAFQRATAQLLVKAQGAGLPITLYHDNSSIVTGADTRFMPVRTEAVEVTQAIQNLYHSVTLVALKMTVVRVYLSYRSAPPITVRGELRLRRSPGGPVVAVASLNTVVLDSSQFGQLDAQRHEVQRSLNFLLPMDQTAAGPLIVELARLTDVGTGNSIDPGPTSPLSVTFVASPPLRLRVLGISYPFGTPPQTHTPSVLDFGLINSWLQRAYPVAQVLSSEAIVAATPTPPFSCGQINAQVAAMRAMDVSTGADNRTHYYGLVSDGGFFMRGCAAVPGAPDPTAIGSGPCGPASWGWDFDNSYGDWYTGHELGHTLGRKHPGACGESMDDPAYPFTAGQLSDADNAFVGFDVGDPAYGLPMTALPGIQWHDVMTYCDRQWLSSYTYQGIWTRLVAEDALSPGPSPGPGPGFAGRPDERFPEKVERKKTAVGKRNLISVVAMVNLTKREGKIEYVNPVPQGELSRPAPESPVVVLVKRLDGQVLYECPVGVKPLSDTARGQDELGIVDAIIAAEADAKVIELSIAGRSVDTFRASETPPGVRRVRRAAADPHAPVVAWETDARPQDKHTYSVQASTDNGKTWQTLAVGLTSTQVAIDRSQFRGAKQVLIRVIATDGFRRSEVIDVLTPDEAESS